jgi:Spy/CpxP family protein refolding chaperone
MRKKWLVLVLAGLVIAGLVGSAAVYGSENKTLGSQGRTFVGKGRPGKHTLGLASRLNLTAEQKEKMANLRLTFKEETLELRTEIARKRLEIQKLLLEESPDLTRVYGLVDEMAPIQAEIQKKAIEFGLKLKGLLTKEQLDKLPGLGFGLGGFMKQRGAMAGGCLWR